MSSDTAHAWAVLQQVPDPEVPVLSVCDLGLVREVVVHEQAVEVTLTPTYSGCPATEVIATYTYKIGIINGQYSYSTAIGLFNTLVNFVFLITANAIAKRVSDTSIF